MLANGLYIIIMSTYVTIEIYINIYIIIEFSCCGRRRVLNLIFFFVLSNNPNADKPDPIKIFFL